MIIYGLDLNGFSIDYIQKISEVTDAIYLGNHQLQLKPDIWSSHTFSCFYSFPRESYFGFYWFDQEIKMIDAQTLTLPFKGIQFGDQVLWSRRKTEKRVYEDSWIAGGREPRTNRPDLLRNIEIIDGQFYVDGKLDAY